MKKHSFIISMITAALIMSNTVAVMADTDEAISVQEEIQVSSEEELADPPAVDEEDLEMPESEEGDVVMEENSEEETAPSDDDQEEAYQQENREEVYEDAPAPEQQVTEVIEEQPEEIIEVGEELPGEESFEDIDDTEDEDNGGKKGKKEKPKGPPQFVAPHAIPQLTGDWRDDFVEIAKSQIGYHEASDGSTYFGNRSGITYSAWCTAFVSWCAGSAGIPVKSIPRVLTSTKYIEFYAPQDRFFYVKGGIDAAGSTFIRTRGYDDIAKIKPSAIEPGDIVLFDTDRNPNDGPDHTAIFIGLSKDGSGIINLSGNSNNSVNITTKSISTVYGICKPVFDRKEFRPDPVMLKSVKNTGKGIKLTWDTSEDADGYEVYAKRINDPDWDDYERITDINSIMTDNSLVFEDVKNGDKLAFYVKAYSIVSDDDITDRVYSKRSAKKTCVFLKRSSMKVVKNVEEYAIRISWKKNSRCSGYQIQCSTDEDFDEYRSITVASALTTHKTLSGLEEDETYYVRMRPFTRSKNRTYYGAWKQYKKGIKIRK